MANFNNETQEIQIVNKFFFAILSITLGIFGVHWFYAKNYKKGWLYLLFSWTTIPFFFSIYDCIKALITVTDTSYQIDVSHGIKRIDPGEQKLAMSNKNQITPPLVSINIKSKSDQFTDNIADKTIQKKKSYIKARKPSYDFTVFDLETTGLRASEHEIIEIGALKFKNDEIVDKFHSYVKPYGTISSRITDLTGIDHNTVQNAPRIDEVLKEFSEFSKGETLVAHNAPFDMNFLITNSEEFIGYRVIDTLPLARKKLTFLKNHKLVTIKEYLQVNVDSHNALDDCKVTGILYQTIRE